MFADGLCMCSHANMGCMTRDDWPLGPALREARVKAGLSARAAAAATNGLISSGRWYQLESGVQKVKGRDVPIGTTPETVVAAALVTGWDVGEALTIAGMTATEAAVRDVEKKIFGDDVSRDSAEPRWLLYLAAMIEYVQARRNQPDADIAALLWECEYLASLALEATPDLSSGIDEAIAYGDRMNKLLTALRAEQQAHNHGRGRNDNQPDTEDSPATQPRAQGEAREDQKIVKPTPFRKPGSTSTAGSHAAEDLTPDDVREQPEDAIAARTRDPRFAPDDPAGYYGTNDIGEESQDPEDHE